MHRLAVTVMLLAVAGPASAQFRGGAIDPSLDQVQALQSAVQKIIALSEPSIACILVTRSELYQRLGYPPPDSFGHLGKFNVNLIRNFAREEELRQRRKLDLADPNHVPESFGSGIVIDAQGLVLTNYHVVQDATKIFVRLPGGRGSYADVHAADPRSDLAVLQLTDIKILPLTALPLGDATHLERGQFVLTMAHPYAAGVRDGQPSASFGMISNLRRRVPGVTREEDLAIKPLYLYGTLLQVDTRINLGCSGGAVLNLRGECIGLLSSLAGIQGGETPGGFALPMTNNLRRIVDVLKRGEEAEYGFLGVGFPERIPDGIEGVPLQYVTPGSPAQLQGNLHGQAHDPKSTDTILSVNDQPVRDSDDLFLFLGTQLAGTRIKLSVRRSGKEIKTVDVNLAKFYVPGKKIASSFGSRPFVKGLRVDYTSLLVQKPFGLHNIPRGVMVSEIAPNSPASARLKIGDVITEINQSPVANPPSFYRAITNPLAPVELLLADPPNTKITLR